MSIRIVLADDHTIFLSGLRTLLEKEPDLEVVAKVKDGREAVRVAHEKRPDLVVMDVSMPGMNGIEATRQITATLPRVKVLCLSMHSEEQFVTAVLEGGASGYLLKECALDELLTAIRTVMANQIFLSPTITTTVVQNYRAQRGATQPSPVSPLTDREREVLQLIAEGHSTKDIAARLHLSVKTIDTHRHRIMDKLRIHSVAGLTKYAIRRGLTTAQ
jgi:DNA-binding NarL/FixJ family response regulator